MIDIGVIGGGVIGLACAWKLAARGLRVCVYERRCVGGGASGASLGVLAPPSPISQQPLQVLHRKSLASFPGFVEALENTGGVTIGYDRCGAIELLPSSSQYRHAMEEVGFTAQHGPAMPELPGLQHLAPPEISALEPAVIAPEYGGLWSPSTAKVEVAAMMAGLTAACRSSGVDITEGLGIQGIELTGEKVTGLLTAEGRRPCGAVLVAAGAWSSFLHPLLERYAGVKPVRGQARTIVVPQVPIRRIIKRARGYILPWDVDAVGVGSTTERHSGFDERTTDPGQVEIMGKAAAIVPSLAFAPARQMWAGLRPAPLDRRATMGLVPETDGLFVAAGHYKIGFGFAPACASLMEAMIVDRTVPPEAVPFLPRTFSGPKTGHRRRENGSAA